LDFLIREYSARIPPSPLLSARSAIKTYFRVVCKVRVQMMQESAPSMYSFKGSEFSLAATIAFITYNGEVPISPKTIPSDTTTPKKESFFKLNGVADSSLVI